MAGRRSYGRLIAALTLAVALLHWAALSWLGSQWVEPSVLRPLATPLFTRTLQPNVAAASATRSSKRVRKAPRSSSEQSIASVALPAPEPALQAPEPVIEQVPEVVAEEAAPAPVDVAPAPPTEVAVVAPADTWPANTRLTYQAGGFFRGRLWGDAKVQWQREGERYQVQLEVSFGWPVRLNMTSQGQVTATQLLPEVFEEETITARRHLRFTPQEMVLMNGDHLPRPPGVQDTASQFVELSHRFATAHTPLTVGQSVELWLARPDGANVWTYDVVELETLQTPHLGAVQAFHLKPRPLAHPRGPITAEMWFAPALQYLPVRIKVTLNDEAWVDLLVDKIDQSELAPPGARTSP